MKKEEKDEVEEVQEEQSEELPQENKKKDINYKPIIIFLGIILLILLSITASNYINKKEEEMKLLKQLEYNNKQETVNKGTVKEENHEEVLRGKKAIEHVKPYVAVKSMNKLFLLDEYSNILWQKDIDGIVAAATDGNYLYFTDHTILNRLDITTKEVETLDSIIIASNKISVDDDYLIFPNSGSLTLINLMDGTKRNFSIGCDDNSEAYILDKKVFCISNHSLIYYDINYDISTYNKKTISNDSYRIVDVSKSWILYNRDIDDQRTYYMYNVYSQANIQIPDNASTITSRQLYDNNVYYRKMNIIYRFDGNEATEFYQFTPNKRQSVMNFRMLLNSRMVIEAYTYDECPSGAYICDAYWSTLYVVNKNTGKKQEINRDIYGYSDYGLSTIYSFYE